MPPTNAYARWSTGQTLPDAALVTARLTSWVNAPLWMPNTSGQTTVDVRVVQERIEGFPLGHRQVSCRSGSSVGAATLSTPAQLLAVLQVGEDIQRHDLGGQGKLSLPGRGRHEGPPTGKGAWGEEPLRATTAVTRLGNALDLFYRLGGQIADVQKLHDGSCRSARLLRLCRTLFGGGGSERAGVDQAACVDSQCPPQARQPRMIGSDSSGGRTDGGMGDAAPRSAVSGGVGEA
jgi:hypothetical protein